MDELKDFLTNLFQTNGTEVFTDPNQTNQTEPEQNQPEPDKNQAEPSEALSEDSIRKIFKEEFSKMIKESMEAKANAQKAARAASVNKVPEPVPERSAEDVLADRFKRINNYKEEKEK